MGNVVINAFGGEGTLFMRTFLAAAPAWPWADPQNTIILMRWLDLANSAEGADGTTDAASTANMCTVYGKNARVISQVFGVPDLMTAAPSLTQGENTIAAAYASGAKGQDAHLLELQFTKAEQAESHNRGFQGDPCAGTACIRGQEHPLPEEYFTPKTPDRNSGVMNAFEPQVWITVGGFRGGGCATTLVPYEARMRMKEAQLNGVTSVLIATLPYSSHEPAPQGVNMPQLDSDNAFSGSLAILSGGFEIGNWAKRYFISSYLENGSVYRPLTARFNVDEQRTTLIATNLVTADCAYRAITGADSPNDFDNSTVYVPVIDENIQNGFGYKLGVDIKKMRALCWFSAALKELVMGWASHNYKAQRPDTDKQIALDLNDYCEEMLKVFEQLQAGRNTSLNDAKATPFVFMPPAFFGNYFKSYAKETWWEAMVNGDAGKEDDFHVELMSEYKVWVKFSNKVLASALEKKGQSMAEVLADLFKRFVKETETWKYNVKNSANAGGKTRYMFPLTTATVNTKVPFGVPNPGDATVMGAVAAEAAKNEWSGYIGGSCGRLFDFQAAIGSKKVDESNQTVVRYTALLFSHFLRDLREINLHKTVYNLATENSIFTDMQKHLNFTDGIHVGEVNGNKVCSYMRQDNGTGFGFYLLPTPGLWGASEVEAKTESGETVTRLVYNENSAWLELVGFNVDTMQPPKNVDEVIADLTKFELQICYTMIYAINHYLPSNTGEIDTSSGTSGSVHPNFKAAEQLLHLLEEKLRSKVSREAGTTSAYQHATWEKMDYEDLSCKFIEGQVFNPHKFFSKKLAYYRMETGVKGSRSGGIYSAYPFQDAGAEKLSQYEHCDLRLKVDFDVQSGDARKIAVTLDFKRKGSQIDESRSFAYEGANLERLAAVPAISVVPQFLGYKDGAPQVVYRYLWAAFGSDMNRPPCDISTKSPALMITLPDLPAEGTWKLCQKKQMVAEERVDAAWSAVSTEERMWWNLCNSKNTKEFYGCFGRNPIIIPANQNNVTVPLTAPAATAYSLEMYFDFGTANSHMDVYVKNAAGGFIVNTPDETAFEPFKSEYYLTLDLTQSEFVNDQIIRLHEENLTPTSARSKTIPTMIQAYGQLGNADKEYVFESGSAQYEVGRVVYPLKQTMNRIYTVAIGKRKDNGEPESEPRSLAALGFCDQMKVATGTATENKSLEFKREFFMRGFIQNVVARYYTQYHSWPIDIQLYCSYPTDALKEQYFHQLVKMLPNLKLNGNFFSEAISFVCYDGVGGSTKVKKDSVTIDIGAGTTDIAICRWSGTEWILNKTASLQFAGMRIVEQSIIENLQHDKASVSDVFNDLDKDRLDLLDTLLKDTSQPDALRMLIRNLIADGYLRSDASIFDERLRVRMVLRTVGLLLTVKEMIGTDWNDFELYLHGGPIASLKQINLKHNSFEQMVSLILGKKPQWDSNKAAITVGMSRIVHGAEQIAVNRSNISPENRYQENLLECGIQTVFNSPNTENVHNFQYDECNIYDLAVDAIKVLAGLEPGEAKTLDELKVYNHVQKDGDLRALVQKIVAAKKDSRFEGRIQSDIQKCQYYDGMDSRLLTMYAIDAALSDTKFEDVNWK